ncbi:hypothetical protein Tco_0121787 [Tanacetum coccineum]
MPNPEDISDPTTAIYMTLILMAKAFKLNDTTPTNNNQTSSSNPCNTQTTQPGNQIGCNAVHNVGNQVGKNMVQNPSIQNVRNKNGLSVVLGIANQNGNGNVVATRAEGAYDEIEEVNVNCTFNDNLQQASTSGTQTDKAPVYDSNGPAEPHHSKNCYDNDIFNMFTQEEHVEQNGRTAEQHPATVEETRSYFESLYNNLVIEVEKVNTVNRKMKETNVDLTIELSVYQEQCLTKKINALYLSFAKTIMTLNEEIANLNNQLSKEKSIVSYLQQEKKKLKSDFKIRKDDLLDKQIQLEQKINELDNILVKMEKHDPPIVYDSEETLQLAQESHLKMKQLNKDIKPANYAKINQLSEVFVSQKAKPREELYFLDTSKTASVSKSVSKSISIPNKECSDDTSPSVARKFLNELKVDARVQNFEIKFLKEVAKFVRDFKYLAQEAVESLAKHKALEYKTERLLRVVVSQDIMSIVQNHLVVDTSNLQTGLDHTLDPLSQKLEDENVSLEFQFIPKVVESNALSKPVTSNSAPSTRESKVNNDRVIAPGMFRINPSKTSRVDNVVPNKHVKASVRTKLITVSKPHVITKKDVNSNTNGLPSTGVESTAKTRRPQPMSNPKNDRIPSASKSSCISINLEKVEVYHRNLLFSKTPNHRSYGCNNIKFAIRNDKFEVICATCKQCLITANHDECVLKYVNGMTSNKKNQCTDVSKSTNQKKHKPNVKKSKKLGFEERLASPRPSKPRTCLRWLPSGRIFYLSGTIAESSNIESESDTSVYDNASASNPQEPTSKGFPNSTSFLDRFMRLWRQNTCLYPLVVL